MEKGDLTGESGEVVSGLLDPKDAAQTRSAMQGTWGSRYSPALEADLIALSRQSETMHDSIYCAPSKQQNKSGATVGRRIKAMTDTDPNNSGRAAWGLNQGVSSEQAPTVAEAALKLVSFEQLRRTAGLEAGEALCGAGPTGISPGAGRKAQPAGGEAHCGPADHCRNRTSGKTRDGLRGAG